MLLWPAVNFNRRMTISLRNESRSAVGRSVVRCIEPGLGL
jgi:hypothetical protein